MVVRIRPFQGMKEFWLVGWLIDHWVVGGLAGEGWRGIESKAKIPFVHNVNDECECVHTKMDT